MKIKTLLAAATLACTAFHANALQYEISPPNPLGISGQNGIWFGNEPNGLNQLSDVRNLVQDQTLQLAYKQNAGGGEEGSLAGSYLTTFQDDPTTGGVDNSGATITNVGNPYIDAAKIYAYVKDGSANPNWFLFDISDWNGTDELVFSGFFLGGGTIPSGGSISHVSVYSAGGGTSVPDGGATALMLGFGIMSVGFVSRRLNALKA